jgi:uncharacterized tellurite resistance protein B-like protein
MADKTYNIAEALTVIYKLMIDVDGENQDGEVEVVVELIQKYADHVDQDIGSVVNNALQLYRSQTVEQNFEFATNVASNLNQFFTHETLVLIAQDLAVIAMADGELHENESRYWSHILKSMGVSPDELKG